MRQGRKRRECSALKAKESEAIAASNKRGSQLCSQSAAAFGRTHAAPATHKSPSRAPPAMTRTCLGRPTTLQKPTLGKSSPAKPALMTPLPLSMTTGVCCSAFMVKTSAAKSREQKDSQAQAALGWQSRGRQSRIQGGRRARHMGTSNKVTY